MSQANREPIRRHSSNGKNRFDKALIQARNQHKDVVLTLAGELPSTDEDGCMQVTIVEVDTYAVKVKDRNDRESWISKSFIVETEIL